MLVLVVVWYVGVVDGELECCCWMLVGEVYVVDDLLGVGCVELWVLSVVFLVICGGLVVLFFMLMEFCFVGEMYWVWCLVECGLVLLMVDDLCLLGG